MSIGQSIKGLFVKQEEPSVPATEAPEQEEVVVPARSSRAGSAKTSKVGDDAGEDVEVTSSEDIDKDILANLEKALDDNTPKSYGYTQFRDTLDKMKKKIPSEASRFTAALAAADAQGASPSVIISTAQDALTVLKGEQTQFKSEIAALNKADEAKQAELKEVEDQIKALTSKQTKLNKELEASAARIQVTQLKFQTTYKSLVAEINADIEKVTEYSSK